jgi:hypothetical protein
MSTAIVSASSKNCSLRWSYYEQLLDNSAGMVLLASLQRLLKRLAPAY